MSVHEVVDDRLVGRIDLFELDAHADAAVAPGDAALGVDVDALAKNLSGLLEDDDRRVRLARAAHEHIQQFTWEQSTRELVDALSASLSAVR